MGSILDKLVTYRSLGVVNLLRVVTYRLGVRFGIHPVQKAKARFGKGAFWRESNCASQVREDVLQFDPLLFSKHPLHHQPKQATQIPNWHCNQLTGVALADTKRPWWSISDFSNEVGDIKTVWELSRMDWAPCFALAAAQGHRDALTKLNEWIENWCVENPPYLGPNWKCGQESSIRLINIALASFLLQQWQACSDNLQQFVEVHLKRIAPSVSYAIAQDNNHGTSEAVGLYIGGSWLRSLGNKHGATWQIQGERLLENRVQKLIGDDGSFSQYSTNYHRLMLDTLSLAEFWRKLIDQRPFSKQLYERATKATEWLYRMVDEASGDAPNTGANDGARFFHFVKSDYRDFRPSVQLASALFTQSLAYTNCESANQLLAKLKIQPPAKPLEIDRTHDSQDGGFAILQSGSSKLLFRYPRFQFRPSHCDALHVDLFLSGRNVLRDAGTYSYNCDTAVYEKLRGTAGHNTIQFDGRDQMPKLSRFLFGSWLKTTDKVPLQVSPDAKSIGAGYCDDRGAKHHRLVKLMPQAMIVTDKAEGSFQTAVLRWRLLPANWIVTRQDESAITIETQGDPKLKMRVTCSSRLDSCSIKSGQESRYYFELTECPVLELQFSEPCQLETTLEW